MFVKGENVARWHRAGFRAYWRWNIKGDVVSYDDYLQCHNFYDGRKKGLVKVVDRDHIVEDGGVIEIRFNV
jgi:ribosome-binding ATPase YchF (GTP1/OBG family)